MKRLHFYKGILFSLCLFVLLLSGCSLQRGVSFSYTPLQGGESLELSTQQDGFRLAYSVEVIGATDDSEVTMVLSGAEGEILKEVLLSDGLNRGMLTTETSNILESPVFYISFMGNAEELLASFDTDRSMTLKESTASSEVLSSE